MLSSLSSFHPRPFHFFFPFSHPHSLSLRRVNEANKKKNCLCLTWSKSHEERKERKRYWSDTMSRWGQVWQEIIPDIFKTNNFTYVLAILKYKKIIDDKLTNEEYYKTLRETCEYLYQIMSHLRYKTETARRASTWWPSRKLSSFKHSPKLSFLVRFSGALFPGISINMRKSWKLYKSKAIQLDFYDWIVIWHWYNDVW